MKVWVLLVNASGRFVAHVWGSNGLNVDKLINGKHDFAFTNDGLVLSNFSNFLALICKIGLQLVSIFFEQDIFNSLIK